MVIKRWNRWMLDNVVALCPNCHRKMHELNEEIILKN